ncbi:uncharacterized protein LOC121760618 [Salvia splendens]|uniref:uncharacterized protein LOC121760618 n=1 Tax=Salvia splendens TaxID=180675 RepID=UPI001C256602|nr:uncharacterized protein LOC121760618 [Salvia splendens]
MVSEPWTRLFEATRVSNLPRIASDHGPVLVRCKLMNNSEGGRAFRFQNMWTRHEGFINLVHEDWGIPTEAEGLLNLKIKLARTKKTLKRWNKEVFGNIHANLRESEGRIAVAQAEFEANPAPRNRADLNKDVANYILLLKMEEDFWRQKAALRWLEDGDKNTKFYQSWVKQKRIRLRIHKIKDNGEEITDEKEVRDSAVNFFQHLLAPDHPELMEPDLDIIRQLPQSEQLEGMSTPPDKDEVKRAVFDIAGNSAPGPDGYTATFYQSCWGIVGADVVDAIRQFLEGAFLPRSITATSIVLIPKKPVPNTWGDYWPISLCNVINKVITKILFVLRQGDPISPVLFVLAADYLSRALDKVILGKKGVTFKATRGCMEISHLAYADDIIIFTQAAPTSLRRLKGCLDHYAEVSGQQINLSKSNFYIADVHEEWASSIQNEGGFSQGTFPFLYLGVPIYRGAKRTDMFMFLREKIAARISGWAHRHLSFGGRLTLIKSTLEAVPIHIFQAIEPTCGALKQLDQQLARFFWGSTSEKNRTHWIRWDQACLPTAEGGLGIRKFKEVLRAFSLKLWWRFLEQNSLWATYMMAKYCRKRSPLTIRASGGNSSTCKRILKVRAQES